MSEERLCAPGGSSVPTQSFRLPFVIAPEARLVDSVSNRAAKTEIFCRSLEELQDSPGGPLFALVGKETILTAPIMRITYFKEALAARYCFIARQDNPICLILPRDWHISEQMRLLWVREDYLIIELTFGRWPYYEKWLASDADQYRIEEPPA